MEFEGFGINQKFRLAFRTMQEAENTLDVTFQKISSTEAKNLLTGEIIEPSPRQSVIPVI